MTNRPWLVCAGAVVLMSLVSTGRLPSLAELTPAALADIASSKAIVDAAKARGIVGEQADGYLGLVSGSADSATTAAVAEINAARAALYRDVASKTGVSAQAAGEAAAKQVLARVPPGEYYRPLGGGWTRK